MLLPKRVKYRRPHRLSYEGKAKAGTEIDKGEIGIQCCEGCYITNNQIEAARICLARYTKRQGKIWVRIFPHLSKTKRPLGVRMGSGCQKFFSHGIYLSSQRLFKGKSWTAR